MTFNVGYNHFCIHLQKKKKQNKNTECLKPLGVQSGEISDKQLSASSEWDINHGAKRGRLNIKKDGPLRGAWSSRRNDQNQWIQIDLLTSYTAVRGVATQGRYDWNQWVTQYRLQYGNDGENFEFYTVAAGQSAIKVKGFDLC